MPTPDKTHRIRPAIVRRSRRFRRPLTPPEAKVWRAVRDRQLGFKLRRQHPIGRFIADFYCAEAKLVVEIDGDVHGEKGQADHDAARNSWLEEHGYAIRRIQAREVDKDLDGVVLAIREASEVRRR